MDRTTHRRSWFGPAAVIAWASTLAVMLFGGAVALVAVGSLCEDSSGSAGSDAYCKGGGMDASAFAIAGLAAAALFAPAVALAVGSKRLFWGSLVSPVLLVGGDVLLSMTLGTN